jgi:serine/threonine protein kinase
VLHNKSLAADTRTEFMAEVKIMSQLYHPNIVLFLGGTFPAAQTGGAEPDKLVMVTQYMRGGSLLQLIEDLQRPITLLQALTMARDTALGMNWLHSRNPCLLHLDLKPANLLIDEHGTVKVADFGISILVERGQVSKDSGRLRGSLPYMPPERLLQQPYDATADVYSFAMTVWQMLNRETPFSDLEKLFEQMNNMADFMVMFRRRVCQEHYRPPLQSTAPLVHDLLTRCWDTAARERPQFSTLISELNGLIIAATIDDPAGRIFWRKQFMSKGKFQTASTTIASLRALSSTFASSTTTIARSPCCACCSRAPAAAATAPSTSPPCRSSATLPTGSARSPTRTATRWCAAASTSPRTSRAPPRPRRRRACAATPSTATSPAPRPSSCSPASRKALFSFAPAPRRRRIRS